MRQLLAVLLLLPTLSFGGAYVGIAGRLFTHPLCIPPDINKNLTFYAPLTQDLTAFGAGATGATWTGGAITGAGAVYYADDPAGTGLLKATTSGVPVFVPNGYQALGAVGNSLLWSCGFTAASWTTALQAGSNGPAIVAPDGSSSTCYLIYADSTNGAHGVYQNWTGTAGKAATEGIYAKATTKCPYLLLQIGDAGSGYVRRWFKLTDGTLGTATKAGSASDWWESSATITPAPLGWYRCVVVTGTPSGTARSFVAYQAEGDASLSHADAGASLFIWGASVWDNATFQYPGVIVTGAVAGSRSADLGSWLVAGNIGNPFTAAVTQTAGVLASSVGGNEIGFSTNDANNLNGFRMGVSAIANFPTFATITDTVQSAITGATGAFVVGTPKRLALAAALNDVEGFADGVSMGTDTSAAVPTHTTLYAGRTGASNVIAQGSVKGAMVFGVRLNAADVARLR